MVVQRKHFPTILKDNEAIYFGHLEGVLEASDELCKVMIVRSEGAYSFRIAPSHPKYINSLVNSITEIHTTFGIRVEFSKSIKTSGSIVFKVNINH